MLGGLQNCCHCCGEEKHACCCCKLNPEPSLLYTNTQDSSVSNSTLSKWILLVKSKMCPKFLMSCYLLHIQLSSDSRLYGSDKFTFELNILLARGYFVAVYLSFVNG